MYFTYILKEMTKCVTVNSEIIQYGEEPIINAYIHSQCYMLIERDC